MKNFKNFMTFFIIQFTSYALLCVSYRAIVKADYVILGVVDFTIASLNFFQWCGYALGGVIGSLLGTWASINLLAN